VAAVKGLYDLYAEITRQLAGPLYLDAKIYFAAGRGILNGLDPYREVFESKPPGMFQISALSLWISNTQMTASILQVVVLLGTLVCSVLFTQKLTRLAPASERQPWILLSFLLGLLFVQYSALQSGYIQTESFAIFFVLLYFLTLAWSTNQISVLRIIIASLFFFLAIWFKEPFGIALLTGALLLSKTVRDFIRSFIIPAIAAGILGIVMLWILGYLDSYIELYLPQMFGTHTQSEGSPWIRGLYAFRMLKDLFLFSPFLCSAFLLSLIGLPLPSILSQGNRLVIACIAFFAAVISPFIPFPLILLATDTKLTAIDTTTLLLYTVLSTAAGYVLLWFLTETQERASLMRRAIVISVCIYFTSTFVGLSAKFYPHHFIVAIPLYVLLLSISAKAILSWLSIFQQRILVSVCLILASVGIFLFPTARMMDPFKTEAHEVTYHQNAERLDRLMDQCDFERYIFYGWEGENLWAYTKHSVYGSSYTNLTWNLDRTIPVFADMFSKRLSESPLIVIFEERIPDLVNLTQGTLWSVYTRDIPECAKADMPVADYTLLFHR
jgi:hypothetical protein